MEDQKKNIIIESEVENKENKEFDELKQRAGDFAKAAGGVAGAFGKFAHKKGKAFIEKVESEEFQNKVNANIKAVTDRIDDYLSANDDNKDTNEISDEQQVTSGSPSKEEGANAITTSVEVEGNETVSFDIKKPKKGIAAAVERRKIERAEKKAEKERKRKEQQKQSLIMAGVAFAILIVMIGVMGLNEEDHTGQIKAPISSSQVSGLNYEEVVAEFKNAGFTDVKPMKIEDLISGVLVTDGEIEKVSIDGDENYSSATWYDPEVKVLVYYHTFPEKTIASTEENQANVEPKEFSSIDIPDNLTEPTYFGYITLSERCDGYYGGKWRFILKEEPPIILEIENLLDSELPDSDKKTLEKAKNGHTEDYVFTLTGYGLFKPSEDDKENGGTLILENAKAVSIRYDMYDKALIYN